MRVRELLNIILLSVSLSTVLISIVSYILFKVKQKNNSADVENPLEGVFFRKYAPHILKKIEEERRRLVEEGKKPRSFKIKFSVASGVVFLIVISGMFLENYFQFRESLNNRITTANRIRSLIDDGLLQVYKYNPQENNKEMLEGVSSTFNNYQANLFEQLRNHKFCFYSNIQSQKYSHLHKQKLEQWTNYFKKNNLNSQVTEQLNIQDCNYIFVHVNSLRDDQRNDIRNLIRGENSREVVIVGELGNLNGIGNKSNESIEIPFLADKNKSKAIRYYQSFKKDEEINILPPGKILPITPNDLTLEFYAEKNTYLFDKDLKTTFYSEVKNALYFGVDIENPESATQQYINGFIIDRISNFLKLDRALPSFWPMDYRGAVSLNLDLSGDVELNNRFEDYLKDSQYPFTMIMSSTLVSRYGDVGAKKYSEVIPTLLNSQAYFDMTTFELFNSLSKLRLDIEEKTALKVTGFTVQNRNQSISMMNACVQNHLNYFLGIENFYTTYPVKMDEEFYYLNSTTFSDIQINKKLLLEEKPLTTLYQRKVIEEGAMLNYVINPTVGNYIDQDIYLKDLLNAIDPSKVWVTTPGEIVRWVRSRETLVINWIKTSESKKLVIKNSGEEDMGKFKLNIYTHSKPVEDIEEIKSISDNRYVLSIESLKANEEFVLELK